MGILIVNFHRCYYRYAGKQILKVNGLIPSNGYRFCGLPGDFPSLSFCKIDLDNNSIHFIPKKMNNKIYLRELIVPGEIQPLSSLLKESLNRKSQHSGILLTKSTLLSFTFHISFAKICKKRKSKIVIEVNHVFSILIS